MAKENLKEEFEIDYDHLLMRLMKHEYLFKDDNLETSMYIWDYCGEMLLREWFLDDIDDTDSDEYFDIVDSYHAKAYDWFIEYRFDNLSHIYNMSDSYHNLIQELSESIINDSTGYTSRSGIKSIYYYMLGNTKNVTRSDVLHGLCLDGFTNVIMKILDNLDIEFEDD